MPTTYPRNPYDNPYAVSEYDVYSGRTIRNGATVDARSLRAWEEISNYTAERRRRYEQEQISARYLRLHEQQLNSIGVFAGNLGGDGGTSNNQSSSGGTTFTHEMLEYARYLIYNNNFINNDKTIVWDEWQRACKSDDLLKIKKDLEKERKLNVQLNDEKDDDMASNIDVSLDSTTLKAVITHIHKYMKGKEDEIKYYEKEIKDCTKEKHPDEEILAGRREIWETRLKNVLTAIKVCEKLEDKFNSSSRPIKLAKNDRKVLGSVLENFKVDYSSICPYSGITNTSHTDKFFMFPLLEKAVKARLLELNNQVKNLTRSDVNVYVR